MGQTAAERLTRFSLVVRPGHPDFLDLPWQQSLSNWRSGRLVEMERGIHRHIVRFVHYDGRLYALKELSQRLAEREYRLLLKSFAGQLEKARHRACQTNANISAPAGKSARFFVTLLLNRKRGNPYTSLILAI